MILCSMTKDVDSHPVYILSYFNIMKVVKQPCTGHDDLMSVRLTVRHDGFKRKVSTKVIIGMMDGTQNISFSSVLVLWPSFLSKEKNINIS